MNCRGRSMVYNLTTDNTTSSGTKTYNLKDTYHHLVEHSKNKEMKVTDLQQQNSMLYQSDCVSDFVDYSF